MRGCLNSESVKEELWSMSFDKVFDYKDKAYFVIIQQKGALITWKTRRRILLAAADEADDKIAKHLTSVRLGGTQEDNHSHLQHWAAQFWTPDV